MASSGGQVIEEGCALDTVTGWNRLCGAYDYCVIDAYEGLG
jgi:hypothetical protein